MGIAETSKTPTAKTYPSRDRKQAASYTAGPAGIKKAPGSKTAVTVTKSKSKAFPLKNKEVYFQSPIIVQETEKLTVVLHPNFEGHDEGFEAICNKMGCHRAKNITKKTYAVINGDSSRDRETAASKKAESVVTQYTYDELIAKSDEYAATKGLGKKFEGFASTIKYGEGKSDACKPTAIDKRTTAQMLKVLKAGGGIKYNRKTHGEGGEEPKKVAKKLEDEMEGEEEDDEMAEDEGEGEEMDVAGEDGEAKDGEEEAGGDDEEAAEEEEAAAEEEEAAAAKGDEEKDEAVEAEA